MTDILSTANLRSFTFSLLVSSCALTGLSAAAHAHADAGNREFPATLTIEDPGVSDELNLPQVNTLNNADGGDERVTEIESEYSKTITDKFALNFGGAYVDDGENRGFDNFSLGAKYQAFVNAEHEAVATLGVDWDIGRSGAKAISERYSTVTPNLYFGKGLGDLGDSVALLRPLALTTQLGVAIPTKGRSDDERIVKTLEYGFAVQYSLPYLQQHVRDVGLPEFVGQMTPLVEFAFETPLSGRSDEDATTGTVNPGLIWSNGTMQVGAEATLPINNQSGSGVGARVQLHFYLDDIFPNSVGRPIW